MNHQLVTVPVEENLESQKINQIRLHGPWLTMARMIWLLLSLIAVGLLLRAIIFDVMDWWPVTGPNCRNSTCRALGEVFPSYHFVAIYFGAGMIVETLPWVFVGALIFWRKSQEPFAYLFSLGLVLAGTLLIDDIVSMVIWDFFPAYIFPLKTLQFLAWGLGVLWYCFPDGIFVPHGTRWFAAAWIVSDIISFAFPDSSFNYATWPQPLPQLIQILFGISVVVSLIYRYRYVAGPMQRQQIQWVVSTGAVYICLFTSSFLIWNWVFDYPSLAALLAVTYLPLLYICSAVFALGVGISILRYRLWDIDIIINRTLVYGALTASVIGIYMLVVGTLGTAIQGRSNLLVSILATGLVAVLVQPLRDRLQRGVNRLMYGDRDDPVTVLSRLGERLEVTIAPDAVLPALVETVAQTLKLPYAAITCGEGVHGKVAAAYGEPTRDLVHLPLSYQGEIIGQLVVSPRAPGEKFSAADDHLLKNIAHQAGMAVHAVSLTADLQHSRQKLVMAREEERRRLRRDLHDGLGPNLASQGLKLAAVKQLLENDLASAVAVLEQVMAQNQSTVEEVRHLVYGLRPPALDELGLVAAIRDYVSGMDKKSTLHIETMEPEEGLPPLSAAVEVAAYRIVLEALTNVIRHAQAKHCRIKFLFDPKDAQPALKIEIQDDGIGLPRDRRSGVGTRSMRERAEEVGGTFILESLAHGGTCVRVWVPLVVM